jgi:hypothetical protein
MSEDRLRELIKAVLHYNITVTIPCSEYNVTHKGTLFYWLEQHADWEEDEEAKRLVKMLRDLGLAERKEG